MLYQHFPDIIPFLLCLSGSSRQSKEWLKYRTWPYYRTRDDHTSTCPSAEGKAGYQGMHGNITCTYTPGTKTHQPPLSSTAQQLAWSHVWMNPRNEISKKNTGFQLLPEAGKPRCRSPAPEIANYLKKKLYRAIIKQATPLLQVKCCS